MFSQLPRFEDAKSDVPGVGQYDVSSAKSTPGVSVGKAKRFDKTLEKQSSRKKLGDCTNVSSSIDHSQENLKSDNARFALASAQKQSKRLAQELNAALKEGQSKLVDLDQLRKDRDGVKAKLQNVLREKQALEVHNSALKSKNMELQKLAKAAAAIEKGKTTKDNRVKGTLNRLEKENTTLTTRVGDLTGKLKDAFEQLASKEQEHSATCQTLQQKITAEIEGNAQMTAAYQAKVNELSMLESDLSAALQRLDMQAAAMREQEHAHLQALHEANQASTARHAELIAQIETLKSMRDQTDDEKKGMEEVVAKLDEINRNANEKADALRMDVQSVTQHLLAEQQANATLNAKVQSLEGINSNLQGEIQTIKQQNEKASAVWAATESSLKQKMSEMQSQVHSLVLKEEELNNTQMWTDALEGENLELQAVCHELCFQKSQLASTNTKLQSKNSDAEGEIVEMDNLLQKLASEHQKLRTVNEKLGAKFFDSFTSWKAAEDRLQNTLQQISALEENQTNIENLQDELNQERSLREKIEFQLQHKVHHLSEQEKENDELQDALNQMKLQVIRTQEKLASSIQSLINSTKTEAQLTQQTAAMQQRVTVLSGVIQNLEASKQKTERDFYDAVSEAKNTEQLMEQTSKQLADVQQEMEGSTQRQQRLQKELEEKERSMAELEAEISSLKAQEQQTQEMAEKIREYTKEVEEQQAEAEKLRELNSKISEELEEVSSKYTDIVASQEPIRQRLESMEKEKEFLAAQTDAAKQQAKDLATQNAKLIGNQNPQQKIKYVQNLKDENQRLREQVASLQKQICNH